jgi:hypothetical protein
MVKIFTFYSHIHWFQVKFFVQRIILLTCLGTVISASHLQAAPVNDADDQTAIKEEVNDDNIRSIQFTKSGLANSYPILQLNSGDQLTLQFDVIGTSPTKNYQFTVVHCDADWKKSNMIQSDYINGLFQDYITNFSFSSGTYIRYAHYLVNFPSASMNVKISGNYALKIYLDDPEKPVLVKRFYVFDQIMGVSGTAQRATYSKYRDTKQEINFVINTNGLPIIDPFREIKTVIKQNWRWDNEITDLKPAYIRDQELIYDYQEGNLFDAGNEFRPLDIRDIRYKGIGVRSFSFDSIYHAHLYPDDDHSYTSYNFYTDQNGSYTITDRNNGDASTIADYVMAHFSLSPTYTDDNGKDIYVFGGLTNWKLDKRFKMTFNKRFGFQCEALLKQGFYDYQYVKVTDGKIDPSEFEGNHWETENNYTIFVYYHPPNVYGDLLAGVLRLNTATQK